MGNSMSAEDGGGFVQAMQTLNLLTQLQNLAKSEEGQQLSRALADMYNSECDVLHIEKSDVFDRLGMTGDKPDSTANGINQQELCSLDKGVVDDESNGAADVKEGEPQKVEGDQEKKEGTDGFQTAILQSLLGQGGPQFGSQEFSDTLIKGMFPDFDKVAGSLAQRMDSNDDLKAKFEALRQKAMQVMENFEKGSNEFCNNIASDPMTCFYYMSQMMPACPAQKAESLADDGVATENDE
jgi:hypothetical protein